MADPNRDIIIENDVPVYDGREMIKNAADKIESAFKRFSGPFEHWKIVLIGAVALVVLLKD